MTSNDASAAAPPAPAQRLLDERLELAAWRLLCVFALLIPISIAAAQIVLGITFAVAGAHWWVRGRPRPGTALDRPIVLFIAACLLAAFLGLDLLQSLWGLRSYLQILVVYLVYAYARRERRALELVGFFLVGMAVTSANTVVTALLPWKVARVFPGQMTQSGQLLFAIGLAGSLWLFGAAWPRTIPFALALYVLALVADMKRGVWLGAVTVAIALGLIGPRRAIFAALALLGALALAAPSVRGRIGDTARDMFLPGNRYDIWAASIDVIQRFPMGIGRKNGTILRDYPNIPKNHKHAHDNLLQIAMEEGILGLAAFLLWMVTFLRMSWKGWRRIPERNAAFRALSVAVFTTFVGFHVAGLVEYNFGDTEVLEIFFLMMGLGLVVNGPSLPARSPAGPV